MDADLVAPRDLTETEEAELREMMNLMLVDIHSSADEEEEAENLIEYAMDMIEGGENVGHIVEELEFMEMSMCDEEVSESVGVVLTKFFQEIQKTTGCGGDNDGDASEGGKKSNNGREALHRSRPPVAASATTTGCPPRGAASSSSSSSGGSDEKRKSWTDELLKKAPGQEGCVELSTVSSNNDDATPATASSSRDKNGGARVGGDEGKEASGRPGVPSPSLSGNLPIAIAEGDGASGEEEEGTTPISSHDSSSSVARKRDIATEGDDLGDRSPEGAAATTEEPERAISDEKTSQLSQGSDREPTGQEKDWNRASSKQLLAACEEGALSEKYSQEQQKQKQHDKENNVSLLKLLREDTRSNVKDVPATLSRKEPERGREPTWKKVQTQNGATSLRDLPKGEVEIAREQNAVATADESAPEGRMAPHLSEREQKEVKPEELPERGSLKQRLAAYQGASPTKTHRAEEKCQENGSLSRDVPEENRKDGGDAPVRPQNATATADESALEQRMLVHKSEQEQKQVKPEELPERGSLKLRLAAYQGASPTKMRRAQEKSQENGSSSKDALEEDEKDFGDDPACTQNALATADESAPEQRILVHKSEQEQKEIKPGELPEQGSLKFRLAAYQVASPMNMRREPERIKGIDGPSSNDASSEGDGEGANDVPVRPQNAAAPAGESASEWRTPPHELEKERKEVKPEELPERGSLKRRLSAFQVASPTRMRRQREQGKDNGSSSKHAPKEDEKDIGDAPIRLQSAAALTNESAAEQRAPPHESERERSEVKPEELPGRGSLRQRLAAYQGASTTKLTAHGQRQGQNKENGSSLKYLLEDDKRDIADAPVRLQNALPPETKPAINPPHKSTQDQKQEKRGEVPRRGSLRQTLAAYQSASSRKMLPEHEQRNETGSLLEDVPEGDEKDLDNAPVPLSLKERMAAFQGGKSPLAATVEEGKDDEEEEKEEDTSAMTLKERMAAYQRKETFRTNQKGGEPKMEDRMSAFVPTEGKRNALQDRMAVFGRAKSKPAPKKELAGIQQRMSLFSPQSSSFSVGSVEWNKPGPREKALRIGHRLSREEAGASSVSLRDRMAKYAETAGAAETGNFAASDKRPLTADRTSVRGWKRPSKGTDENDQAKAVPAGKKKEQEKWKYQAKGVANNSSAAIGMNGPAGRARNSPEGSMVDGSAKQPVAAFMTKGHGSDIKTRLSVYQANVVSPMNKGRPVIPVGDLKGQLSVYQGNMVSPVPSNANEKELSLSEEKAGNVHGISSNNQSDVESPFLTEANSLPDKVAGGSNLKSRLSKYEASVKSPYSAEIKGQTPKYLVNMESHDMPRMAQAKGVSSPNSSESETSQALNGPQIIKLESTEDEKILITPENELTSRDEVAKQLPELASESLDDSDLRDDTNCSSNYISITPSSADMQEEKPSPIEVSVPGDSSQEKEIEHSEGHSIRYVSESGRETHDEMAPPAAEVPPPDASQREDLDSSSSTIPVQNPRGESETDEESPEREPAVSSPVPADETGGHLRARLAKLAEASSSELLEKKKLEEEDRSRTELENLKSEMAKAKQSYEASICLMNSLSTQIMEQEVSAKKAEADMKSAEEGKKKKGRILGKGKKKAKKDYESALATVQAEQKKAREAKDRLAAAQRESEIAQRMVEECREKSERVESDTRRRILATAKSFHQTKLEIKHIELTLSRLSRKEIEEVDKSHRDRPPGHALASLPLDETISEEAGPSSPKEALPINLHGDVSGQEGKADLSKVAENKPSCRTQTGPTDFDYLYYLSVKLEEMNHQFQDITSEKGSSKDEGDVKQAGDPNGNVKSSLNKILGNTTHYTASADWLNEEWIGEHLTRDNKYNALKFRFRDPMLFRLFDKTREESRDNIIRNLIHKLLLHANDITQLDLSSCLLPDKFLQILVEEVLKNPAVSFPNLQLLNFESNLLQGPGIEALSELILDKNACKYLQAILLENQKHSMTSEAGRALADAVRLSPSIVVCSVSIRDQFQSKDINDAILYNMDQLRLARRDRQAKEGTLKERKRNEIELYFDRLADDESDVTEVELVGNQEFLTLDHQEKTKSGMAFATNTFVRTVKMNALGLDDSFAQAFGEAIAINDTIQKVNIDSNAITGAGMKALFDGLCFNNSIDEFQVRHQKKPMATADEEALPDLIASNTSILKLGVDVRSQLVRMKLDRIINTNRDRVRKLCREEKQ